MINALAHGPWAYLGIFLLGLSLNLTPCVYPMLSVTVSLFGAHKAGHPWQAFGRALVYVLGMATMYTGLGAGAALTGGFLGAALQSRAVLLGMSFLFFMLSLSLFGVYSFQAPSKILAKAGPGGSTTGLVTLYLYGLVAGLFAAPCIGPPIITLLTLVGASGDPWYAIRVFFVMALGLGLPYLLIGTFSGLLHRLPRSGVWLLWVDRLFGTVLLGVAGFYAILAFTPKTLAYYVPVALAGGGVYLGFFEKAGDVKTGFKIFKPAFGAALLITAAALFPATAKTSKLAWENYSAEKIVEAKAAHQPVIIDFFADWCIPCHELERFTFSDAGVQRELARFKRLKVNMTHPDADTSEKLIEQFNIQGVPTILFFDARGVEVQDLRISGFIDAKAMLDILRDVK